MMTRPPARPLLPHVSTIDDVVQLIQSCSNIIVLSGAGVSGRGLSHHVRETDLSNGLTALAMGGQLQQWVDTFSNCEGSFSNG